MPTEYERRGVSSTKEDVHAALVGISAGLFPTAFCKVIPDIAGDPHSVTLMHADGAGTKSSVAYLYWKETGDAAVFRGIAQDSLVMNLDDLICVGAVNDFVVSNTIGRNAHRVDKEVVRAIIHGYEAFAERLRRLGFNLVNSGGETADVGDLVRTVIVDSNVCVRMPRASVIDCTQIRPGDVIVGLASGGRARYEDEENSGIGSNGLTLARHVLLNKVYRERFPESFSETVPLDSVYTGPYALRDRLPGSEREVAWGLLSPTRTYAPIIKAVLAARLDVSGIIHCSGGGQSKCLRFGQGLHFIKDALFDAPAVFRALEDCGVPRRDMYQVFNMGHRMELYCRPDAVQKAIELSQSFGIDAKVVGRIEASPNGDSNLVTVADRGEEQRYTLVH
ncbi:MAG: AIR synthase-related protein [Polyangiaceae bacterium]